MLSRLIQKRLFSSSNNTNSASPSKYLVDFSDRASSPYAAKSLVDLLRGVLVFGLCRDPIVSRADRLLDASRSVLGNMITDALLRHTFFAHFTAGETEVQARDTIAHLAKLGVGGILDFAAEADVAVTTTSPAASKPIVITGNLSRSYAYASEASCDMHAAEFQTCIKTSGQGGFAAVKVTALGDPELLKRCSTTIVETRRLFSRIAGQEEGKQTMSREAFRRGYNGFFFGGEQNEADKYFDAIIEKSRLRGLVTPPDEMDLLEWVTSMTPREAANLASRCVSRGPFSSSTLSAAELDLVDSCLKRLDGLAQLAQKEQTRIMIDAEQTYFQPAIDSITLDLQRQFNHEHPTIFSTYQCYLMDSHSRLKFDLNRAQREQWKFACKLVRGAYMLAERKLALESNVPSPIQPSLDATANNYLACAQTLIRSPYAAEIVIATRLFFAHHLSLSLVRFLTHTGCARLIVRCNDKTKKQTTRILSKQY